MGSGGSLRGRRSGLGKPLEKAGTRNAVVREQSVPDTAGVLLGATPSPGWSNDLRSEVLAGGCVEQNQHLPWGPFAV